MRRKPALRRLAAVRTARLQSERIIHALRVESDLASDFARKGDFTHRKADSREQRSTGFDATNIRGELNEGGLLHRGQAVAKQRNSETANQRADGPDWDERPE